MPKLTFVLAVLGIVLGTPGLAWTFTLSTALGNAPMWKKALNAGLMGLSLVTYCMSLWRLGDVADTLH